MQNAQRLKQERYDKELKASIQREIQNPYKRAYKYALEITSKQISGLVTKNEIIKNKLDIYLPNDNSNLLMSYLTRNLPPNLLNKIIQQSSPVSLDEVAKVASLNAIIDYDLIIDYIIAKDAELEEVEAYQNTQDNLALDTAIQDGKQFLPSDLGEDTGYQGNTSRYSNLSDNSNSSFRSVKQFNPTTLNAAQSVQPNEVDSVEGSGFNRVSKVKLAKYQKLAGNDSLHYR
jgi:hypothetical protein